MHTHRHSRSLALALVALGAAACSGVLRSDPSPSGGGSASIGQQRWSATLAPRGGTTAMGSATVTATADGRTRVSISVQGAPPNINLPWHIHPGICGGGSGTVFGSAGAYPMLGTTGDGRARLQVDLNMSPPTSGAHHVDVHAGPGSNGVVACGDLRPASGEN